MASSQHSEHALEIREALGCAALGDYSQIDLAHAALDSLEEQYEGVVRERDEYRIEADHAHDDYEDAEVVIRQIAEKRRNQAFDPWAADLCQTFLDRSSPERGISLREQLDAAHAVGYREGVRNEQARVKEARAGELHAGDHAEELLEQLKAVRRLVAESSERSSMDTLDLLRGLFPLDNPRRSSGSNPATDPTYSGKATLTEYPSGESREIDVSFQDRSQGDG